MATWLLAVLVLGGVNVVVLLIACAVALSRRTTRRRRVADGAAERAPRAAGEVVDLRRSSSKR